MVRKLFSNLKRQAHAFAATVFVASQLLYPFVVATPVQAAPAILSVSTHEGQLSPSGTYSSGNITTYSELETIDFHFTVTATAPASGQMEVQFTGNDTGGQPCLFFQQAFALGTTDNISGTSPTVTTVGAPTADGDEWIQVLDVSATVAGSAVVNYTLTLSDEAGDCGGSSQHSQLGNADSPGDFGNFGANTVPVPANSVLELTNIEIIKNVDDDGDGFNDRNATAGEWSFTLDGLSPVSTDSTGHVSFADVPAGLHTITESDTPGYSFFGDGGDCNGEVVDGVWSFEILPTTDATDLQCNFWNQVTPDEPTTLTLVKEVVDGDATATDWTLYATPQDNQYPTLSGPGGFVATEVTPELLYDLSESTGPDNYLPGDWKCDGGRGMNGPNGTGSVALPVGADVTCTLTNSFTHPPMGTVTVTKSVNDNDGGGGTVEDFDLFVGDTQVVSGDAMEFEPGTYEITEIMNIDGYRHTGTTCKDAATNDNVGNPFTLIADQVINCTVNNADIPPYLTVNKIVDGGNAKPGQFQLYVNGTAIEQGDDINLDTGVVYTITEDQLTGYDFQSIFCWDTETQTPVPHPVSLALGQKVECNVINKAIPRNSGSITVTKEVTNDNGGDATVSDFHLFVGNTQVTSGDENRFAPGQYSISEQMLVDGYKQTHTSCEIRAFGRWWPIPSTFKLKKNQQIRCTVRNNDKPAIVTLFKDVIKADGGNAHFWDFELYLNGERAYHGLPKLVKGNTEYKVSEIANVRGYEQTDISCYDHTAKQELGHPFVAPLGHIITCVVTNDDVAPTITLNKELVDDYNGPATISDFDLIVDGDGEVHRLNSGDSVKLKAGENYVLDEDIVSELEGQYAFVEVTGDNCPVDNLEEPFKLALGESAECTIVNEAIPAQINIEKLTIPKESDQLFEFTIEDSLGVHDNKVELDTDRGTLPPREEAVEVAAGTIKITETAVDGWINGEMVGCRLQSRNGPVTIFDSRDTLTAEFEVNLGDKISCRYGNIQLGDVTVTKFHDVNENGRFDKEDEATLEGWEIHLDELARDDNIRTVADDPMGFSGFTEEDGTITFNNVRPDRQYQLSETLQDGWRQTGIYCEEPSYHDIQNGFVDWVNKKVIDEGRPEEKLTTHCYIGNTYEPVLEISKSNDTPEPTVTGETVTYTITVSVPEESGCVYRQMMKYLPAEIQDDIPRPFMRGCQTEPEETPVEYILQGDDEEEFVPSEVTVTDLPPEGFAYVEGSWTANSNVRGDLKTAGITTEPTYASPGQWLLTSSFSPFLVPGEVVTLTYQALIDNAVTNGEYPDTAFVDGYTFDGFTRFFGNVHSVGTPFVGTQVSVLQTEPIEVGFVLGTLATTGVPAILPIAAGTLIASAALLTGSNRKQRRLFKKMRGALGGVFAGLLLSIFLAGSVIAAGFWTTNLSSPQEFTTSPTVNLDYQVTSTESTDDFVVTLLQDNASVDTATVATDFGDSGRFTVVLPAEGTYEFQTSVLNNGDATIQQSDVVSVTYDVTPPAAPGFGLTQQIGNDYTISFTAPTGDVKAVKIFASTETTFALDASTLVGEVDVTPSEEVTFNYTAPDSDQRYFAVYAVDATGNQSTVVGDELVSTTSSESADGTIGVDGSSDGTVGDEAASSQADVEGATENGEGTTEDTSDSSVFGNIVVVIVILGLGYLLFRRRTE